MNGSDPINININGIQYCVPKGASVAEAIRVMKTLRTDFKTVKYVVAVNQTFVPKNQYQNTQLNENDHIELLTPMAGG